MKRLILPALAIFAAASASWAQSPAISKAVTDYIANSFVSGTGTLVSASATIAQPLVTGSSKILFSPLTTAIVVPISTGTVTSGTSFVAISGTANGSFNYLILNR